MTDEAVQDAILAIKLEQEALASSLSMSASPVSPATSLPSASSSTPSSSSAEPLTPPAHSAQAVPPLDFPFLPNDHVVSLEAYTQPGFGQQWSAEEAYVPTSSSQSHLFDQTFALGTNCVSFHFVPLS